MAKKTTSLVTRGGTEYRKVTRSAGRRRSGTTIPLAVLAGFLPMASDAWSGFLTGGPQGFSNSLVAKTTGYDISNGEFRWEHVRTGIFPIVMGILVHKLVGNRLGINRALGSARIPLLRL